MIWDALVAVILGIVTWLLDLLPDYTVTTGGSGSEALRTVMAGAKAVSVWINLQAMFGVLGLFVTIEASVMATRAAQWVYAKIPAKAT